jgi:hypothetical protein
VAGATATADAAGKGPQLMGTTLTDGEIINRVKKAKWDRCPVWQLFNDDQIKAIIVIRALKPDNK